MLVLPFAPPSGQPYYDNSGASGFVNKTSGTAFTWTQPATAGAYAIVALLAGENPATSETPAGATAAVTFGGTSMSALGSVLFDNVAADGWAWIFGLANAPGGSPATVSVTLTETSDRFAGFALSFTYLNVSSVGSLVTNFGVALTQTLSISSGVGNLVWAVQANEGNVVFSHFNLAARQVNNPSLVSGVADFQPQFMAGDAPGAATVAASATVSASSAWGAAGLNLIGTGI